jgi:hypothetical protein
MWYRHVACGLAMVAGAVTIPVHPPKETINLKHLLGGFEYLGSATLRKDAHE